MDCEIDADDFIFLFEFFFPHDDLDFGFEVIELDDFFGFDFFEFFELFVEFFGGVNELVFVFFL